MKFRRNTGITLIALVVTIIVLLILAGVTLSLALNSNGVFQRSKNAAAAYKEAEEAERAELDRIAGEMDEVMGIYPPLEIPEGLEEGDTITYKPEGTFHWNAELATSCEKDSENYNNADMELATGNKTTNGKEDMSLTEWQVASVDKANETVIIMPKKSTFKIDMETGEVSGVTYLHGAQGYNNAVKLLNDACEALYGNPQKGITARSISMEDIEPSLDGTALETAKNANTPSYGNRYTDAYTEYKKFPSIYASEKNSIVDGILNSNGLNRSKQNSYISRNENTKVGSNIYTATNGFIEPTSINPEQTVYEMNYNTFRTALGEEKAKTILPNDNMTCYFVASRCVRASDGACIFSVNCIDEGRLLVNSICGSDGDVDYGGRSGLFPVVTLKSGVISGDAETGYTFQAN